MGKFGGGFPQGMGNMQNLLKQAQKMQADAAKKQEQVEAMSFEASAGGNAIVVKANGAKKITNITINPDVVDKDDVEMLQDLILTAVNEVLSQADKAMQNEMGDFSMPGLF
ncbi:MAG: YbaB/EbfC family nucleoid-associated protein [Clostridia bacterium]